ncbi:MAG: hypothetical protein MJK18_07105 [Bdellovibrionales bacterium]|nr:hypothetical protein [Bdellovibrionales bacterium]
MAPKKKNSQIKSTQKSKENKSTPLPIEESGQQMGDKMDPGSKQIHDLSDEQIKEISKSWTEREWELYLSSYEVKLHEELFEEPLTIDNISQEHGPDSLFSLIHGARPERKEKLEIAVRKILREHLSKKELQVIWLQYWDQMSQRQIASHLESRRRAVRNYQDRAHRKFKNAILFKKLKNSRSLRAL